MKIKTLDSQLPLIYWLVTTCITFNFPSWFKLWVFDSSINLLTVSTWTKNASDELRLSLGWPGPDQWSKITQIMIYHINKMIALCSQIHWLLWWSEWSWITDPDQSHPKGRTLKITGFTSWDTYPQTNSYWFYSLKSQLVLGLRSDKVRLTFAKH